MCKIKKYDIFKLQLLYLKSTLIIYRELKGDSIDLSVLDPNTNYAITFNPNGGTIAQQDASRTKKYNQPVGTLPTPEWIGYNFIGWFEKDSEGNEIKVDSLENIELRDYVLEAKFEKASGCGNSMLKLMTSLSLLFIVLIKRRK